jgi:hypothetical protein
MIDDGQLASGEEIDREEEQPQIAAPKPEKVGVMEDDEDDQEPLDEEELVEFLKQYGDGPIVSDDALDSDEEFE